MSLEDRRRSRGVAGLLIALMLVATACANDDEGGGADSSDPIVIGLAMAETGPNSAYDLPPGEGALLAIEQINAQGGVLGRQLEGVWLDTKSDPVEGGTKAAQLLERDPVAMIVACDFDLGVAAAQQANQAGIPAFSCAADPKFGDTQTIGPYAFQLNAITPNQSAVMAEWAFNKKGWRDVYILQDVGLEFAKSLGRGFVESWEQLGGRIVGTDTWNALKDVEFGPMITRFQSRGTEADFIWLPSWVPPAASLTRQFRGAGVQTPFTCGDACDGELLVETAGPVSDFYYANLGCFDYCDPGDQGSSEVEAFVKDFTEKFDHPPRAAYALTGYAAIQLIVTAIERADSTEGEDLLAALESFQDVQTLSGPYTFTASSHAPVKKPMHIIEVQNGEFSLLEIYTPEFVPEV